MMAESTLTLIGLDSRTVPLWWEYTDAGTGYFGNRSTVILRNEAELGYRVYVAMVYENRVSSRRDYIMKQLHESQT